MTERKKEMVLKAISKIIVAVLGGLLIAWISKINLESGVPMHTVIGVASGLILLLG